MYSLCRSRRSGAWFCFALCAASLFWAGVPTSSAQQVYFWRGEASNGLWNYGGNWYHVSNNSSSDIPAGNEILRFDNASQLAMTNDLPSTSRFRIEFLAGSGARTVNGTTANTFFDFGGAAPAIYNNSGNTQTVNFDLLNGNSTGSRLELNANSGNFVFGGTLSTSGSGSRILAFLGGGATSVTGQVTQASGTPLSLRVEGAGTVTLSGANNNFTGTTTVAAGTLALTANGSLGGGLANYTSGVGVAGGTLLLGGSAAVTDRINDATPLSLAGAFNTAGLSERVGALTLAGNSTADLGAGASTLAFGGTSTRTAGTLAFSNWDNGSDHIFFYADSTSTAAYTVPDDFLSNVTINGLAVSELATGEIVPVPEPASWVAGFLLLGTGVCGLRRRLRLAA